MAAAVPVNTKVISTRYIVPLLLHKVCSKWKAELFVFHFLSYLSYVCILTMLMMSIGVLTAGEAHRHPDRRVLAISEDLVAQ